MQRDLPNEDRMRLFDAVLKGDAQESQFHELEALLDSEAAARDQFALLAQLDVDLRHVFRTGAMAHVGSAPARTPEPSSRAASGHWLPGRQFWMWSTAVAAAVAVLATGLDYTREDKGDTPQLTAAVVVASRPPAPVATLTSFNHAMWEGQELLVGHTIREGDSIKLASGEAHISVGCGAEIAAKGPCALRFIGFDEIELEYGDVAVHVAEWAKGFTVVTDAMEVVDLGTTFTVSANKESGVHASVLKGLVRVRPKVPDSTGRRGVLVAEGSSYGVDNLGRGDTLNAARERPFQGLDLDALVPYRPIDLHNTGIGLSQGDEDPHWRVDAGDRASLDEARFVVVCKPDERYLENDPSASQWVSMPGWRSAAPNSVYTFQTSFELNGFDLSTIQLFGRFLADNGIREVRVNDRPVKVESWIDNVAMQEFSHSQFRFVNITEGLVAGKNLVEIDVWNGIFQEPVDRTSDPNPMALRVEWHAFGRQAGRPE